MYELVTTKFGERLQEEKVVSKFGERLVALFHNRTWRAHGKGISK